MRRPERPIWLGFRTTTHEQTGQAAHLLRRRLPGAGTHQAEPTIKANTFVRRLIIEGKRCTGVEVETENGSTERINAKTVVVSAGAIMSPAILMRSGLGPATHLESLSIPVVRDIPGVGQNLGDHPALSIAARPKDKSLIDFDQPIIQTILRYTAEGSEKRNDLQIEQFSFTGRRSEADTFGIAAVLEYQYGRGELRLRSADPREHPIVDNRFCEDDRDTERLVKCFKDTLAFTKVGPLAEMIDEVVFPDPSRPLDDDAIAALCRKLSGS
ncbi:MAG TPA: GMC family oxidoreductase N-terminal domain-containing protein, partial [Pseudomonadales bacterium]|nr:GMC family oxidoreductase N-terminal domain-containing protein [Pseudomonadales bacterium]